MTYYNSNQNSVDTSCSSKEYKSNYDTEVDIDRTCRNILCNIQNDDETIFDLKNAMFINYGNDVYNDMMTDYNNIIDKTNVSEFDVDLWQKAIDLYNKKSDEEVNCFCFRVFFKSPIEISKIKEMYDQLIKMKTKYRKIKILIEIDRNYQNNQREQIVIF
jgi:hypothetical protein